MQGDPRHFMGWGSAGYEYEVGGSGYPHIADLGGYYTNEAPAAGYFDPNLVGSNTGCPRIYNGIMFQASENCPKNLVIVDQSNDMSGVMYNPLYAQMSNYAFNVLPTQGRGGTEVHHKDDRLISTSSFKEDSKDIDALLSLEEEDDVISTGRTPSKYSHSSPDSICSTGSKSKSGKLRCLDGQDSVSSGPSSEKKRARVKTMVKVLRGIVPGAQQMDTPAFLDEAIKYLKSLKMEVKNLGIQKSKN